MSTDPRLLLRLDLVVGLLVLQALAIVLVAVAVNPLVGLVGGGVLLGVALCGVYAYLTGVRAYAEAAIADGGVTR